MTLHGLSQNKNKKSSTKKIKTKQQKPKNEKRKKNNKIVGKEKEGSSGQNKRARKGN